VSTEETETMSAGVAGSSGKPASRRLQLATVPKPRPSAQQARVRVRAAGLNRGELIRIAKPGSTSGDGPAVPGGIEFAGEVDSYGDGASGPAIGTRVMGRAPRSFAEFVCTDPRALMPVPDQLTWEQAAGFSNTFVTAHDALVTSASLTAGESVLVNAASSGIGVAAIQIARLLGATPVIATSRSQWKLGFLGEIPLAATSSIVHGEGTIDEVAATTDGRGVDVIIDVLGGQHLSQHVQMLAIKGRLVNVGRTASAEGTLDLDRLALQRARIIGVTFRTRTSDEALECSQRCAEDLLGPLADGRLQVLVDSVFPLAEITAAHEYMLEDAHIGKIVVTI
jgi:NADPH2:quinone reductase